MPPEWFDAKPCGVSSSRCSLPRCAATATPSPISTAFDGVDAHHGVRDVGIEPVEYGLAQARQADRCAITVSFAPTESPSLRSFQM